MREPNEATEALLIGLEACGYTTVYIGRKLASKTFIWGWYRDISENRNIVNNPKLKIEMITSKRDTYSTELDLTPGEYDLTEEL